MLCYYYQWWVGITRTRHLGYLTMSGYEYYSVLCKLYAHAPYMLCVPGFTNQVTITVTAFGGSNVLGTTLCLEAQDCYMYKLVQPCDKLEGLS